MTVLEAVQSGDHRKALEAVRDDLAAAMDCADANVKPQFAAQLRAVLADLRALPSSATDTPKGVVTIDEAKRRRADRKSSATSVPAAGAGGSKRGG